MKNEEKVSRKSVGRFGAHTKILIRYPRARGRIANHLARKFSLRDIDIY
jgi:hypothetical protein